MAFSDRIRAILEKVSKLQKTGEDPKFSAQDIKTLEAIFESTANFRF